MNNFLSKSFIQIYSTPCPSQARCVCMKDFIQSEGEFLAAQTPHNNINVLVLWEDCCISLCDYKLIKNCLLDAEEADITI